MIGFKIKSGLFDHKVLCVNIKNMANQYLEELGRAESYFHEGKLDEALRIFNKLNEISELDKKERYFYQFLHGLILFYIGRFEEVITFGKEVTEEGQKSKIDQQILDGYFLTGIGLCQLYRYEGALKIVEEAEKLLTICENEFIQQKIRINVLKAWIYLEKNDLDLAEKCLIESSNLEKKPKITFEAVWANLIMARIMFQGRSKFELGINYTKKALRLAENIRYNHLWIGLCNLYIGVGKLALTEFETSLKYHFKSLAVFRKIKNNWTIAIAINNIGSIYVKLGDTNLAFKYYQESLLLFEKQGLDIQIPLVNLVELSLENNDMKSAQEYFNRLENLHHENKECLVPFVYSYSKALILKKSNRIRDLAEAENLLKSIANAETIWSEVTINAIIHLCDLLISEFRINNNSEVLTEINQLVIQLLNIAEKGHSYPIFCETFILQAKLALINFDMKTARRFLTQAQKIAESYGIKSLAKKISYEHDELLKKLHQWDLLKKANANLTERIDFARLDEQISIMLKKQRFEVPEISKEEPIMLLILTEGGELMFSKRFVEDVSLEDDILGGFLTTINYIITEVFSEGLERAVFGQYTLLMMPTKPFLVCYIFKGYSYYAHHKTKQFLESIQNDNTIWKSLQISLKESKIVQLKNIPSLESLITEIFVKVKN